MKRKNLVLLLLFASVTSAQTHAVALTFDDLPAAGTMAKADPLQCNRRILKTLKRYSAPATGFVVAGRPLDTAVRTRILRAWVRDGHLLGNHTYSHADLNSLTAPEFEREVMQCEDALDAAIGNARRAPRYLRFPFNHTGNTPEKLAAVGAWLDERGYAVAACTIDNSDYEFSRAYDLMLARRDSRDAARLRRAYIDYTAAEIVYYSELHQRIFHQEIPHVMLLHLNRLNADALSDVLAVFRHKGYRFVTLEQAQSHAAYRTRLTRPTPYGPMWGYRWAKELGVKVDGRIEPQPPAWVLEYGRTDR